MRIETKLKFNDYVKLMYVLTYRKPIMIFITIIGFTMIIGTLGFFLGFQEMYDSPPYVPGALGFTFVVLVPFSIYRGAKKNFSTNGRLTEKIIYDFNETGFIVTGESFTSKLDWTKTYKVTELTNWIIIYQSRQVANVIPKIDFANKLNEFKTIVKSKRIKQSLKK